MCSVLQVANFFIDISNALEDDFMTNMKLNKLLYFAQGIHLARYMEPLFIDEIEAWDYGPVVNSVYQKYKVCGREPIKAVDEDYSHDAFSEKELDTLITTMQEYGKYTAFTLLKLTHNDGPWKQAYYSNSRITKENLLEYFADIAEKIKSPLEQIIERSELVKEFPKEWYDSSEDAIWKPSHA